MADLFPTSIPVWQNAGFNFVPNINYPYIVQTPVNQLYSDYAQQYKISQPKLYNQLTEIANTYDDIYNRWANQLWALYQWYQKNLDQLYKPFFQTSSDIAWQYLSQLKPLYEDVNNNYWPQWTLRQRTDDFYKNLYTYLWTKSAEQQSQIASDASKAGASLQQSLASQNQVLRANLDEYIKAQQNNVSQLDNIYKSYQSMQTSILDRYKATQDQNILKPLESIISAKNQIWLELLKNQQALLSAQLSDKIRKWSIWWSARNVSTGPQYVWTSNQSQTWWLNIYNRPAYVANLSVAKTALANSKTPIENLKKATQFAKALQLPK